MPYKSKAQERWANTPEGKKEMGKKNVEEFNKASKGLKLPEKAPVPKKGKK